MLAGNTQYTKVLVPFSFDGQQLFEQMREELIEVQSDCARSCRHADSSRLLFKEHYEEQRREVQMEEH